MTTYYDPKSLEQTVRLKEPSSFSVLLVKKNNLGVISERWRFLIPYATADENYENAFNTITPYKKPTILDFSGRSVDTLDLTDVLLTTRSKTRSVQPLIDGLKKCLIPDFTTGVTANRDDLDPPLLSLVWGNLVYQRLYLKSLKVRIESDDRLNGVPISAKLSLGFIASLLDTKNYSPSVL
jgi:hypothetical protein